MIDQMRISGLAENTQTAYLFKIGRMAKHYMTSPTDLDADQLRVRILHGIERDLNVVTTNVTVYAPKSSTICEAGIMCLT